MKITVKRDKNMDISYILDQSYKAFKVIVCKSDMAIFACTFYAYSLEIQLLLKNLSKNKCFKVLKCSCKRATEKLGSEF